MYKDDFKHASARVKPYYQSSYLSDNAESFSTYTVYNSISTEHSCPWHQKTDRKMLLFNKVDSKTVAKLHTYSLDKLNILIF